MRIALRHPAARSARAPAPCPPAPGTGRGRLRGQRQRGHRRLRRQRRQARRGRLLHPGIRLHRSPRARLRGDARRARASASATPSAPPATRAARSPRASPHRSSTSRQAGDMERLVEEGEIVAKDWDQNNVQRHRPELGRGHRRPQRQPGGDRELRRPAEQGRRGHHPEPVQLRLSPLEHHGRLRHRDRGGQVPRPGAGGGQAPCSRRPSPSRAAVATRSPPSPRARATSSSPTRTRRSRPKTKAKTSNTSSPPSTLQIETPIAVTKDAPEPAAQDFLDFIWSDEGQEIWAENGYRPVNPKLVDQKQFPTPKDLFTDRRVRRLGQGQRRVLRRRNRLGRQDREGTRGLH